MRGFDLLNGVLILVPLVLSLTVHEYAHAWSAFRLGDDTAARMGRLTLNPLVHMDLLGTVILPLLGIPFGWAKPVPVDPMRFRREVPWRTGMALTAAAGPLANVLLAIAGTVAYGLLARLAPDLLAGVRGLQPLLAMVITLNVTLALFNLLPIPPLDGSRIVDGFLPLRLRPGWEAFSRLAPFLIIGVMIFGGRIIAGPSGYVLGLLQRLLDLIA
ncbi:MAG TPA: site-2 protease family protein [Anaeromyxobacteraceae bacterium]